jgi:hypothetical protein
MQHETIRGRILYTSRKPHMLGQIRGGETFIITRHVDGSRTLRAHCAIDENPPRVLRDSITNVDAEWRPTGGFVQITVDEEFVGSAWYRLSGLTAECEGFTLKEGRISQKIALERPPAFFGTHPIQADAWLTQCYDLSKGPGTQTIESYLMCSLHHRGADGPMLFESRNIDFAFLGEETVDIAAGRFAALHFRIGDNTDDAYMAMDRHPPYHIWVSADGDYILLKAFCTGYMQTWYELAEYDRRTGFF